MQTENKTEGWTNERQSKAMLTKQEGLMLVVVLTLFRAF